MTALGALCCFALFVCLTLLASFFLPSHLSLKTCMLMVYMKLEFGEYQCVCGMPVYVVCLCMCMYVRIILCCVLA